MQGGTYGPMNETVALLTRWIVVFLVIFLLCMLFVFSWIKRPAGSSNKTAEGRR